jgi:hypothetical protein
MAKYGRVLRRQDSSRVVTWGLSAVFEFQLFAEFFGI